MRVLLLFLAFSFWGRISTADAVVAPSQNAVTLHQLIDEYWPGACELARPGLLRCRRRLIFDGIHDLDIRGEGLNIQFSNPDPGRGGILFKGARNIKVSNFTLAWKDSLLRAQGPDVSPPIFSFGKVVACGGGGKLILQVKVQGSLPVAKLMVWDPVDGWPWRTEGRPALEMNYKDGQIQFTDGESACLTSLSSFAGQSVLVKNRKAGHAWECYKCSYVTVDGVTIQSSPGMGFVFNQGDNLVLRRSRVQSQCSLRCLAPEPSLGADASHFGAVGSNILIEDNDFSGQGDDGINVASIMIGCSTTPHGKNMTLLTCPSNGQVRDLIQIGEKLELYDQGLRLKGVTHVINVIEQDRSFVVDGSILGQPVLVSPVDHIPSNVIIRGNYLHDSRARGILLTARHAIIEKNTIERTTMNAILLSGDSRVFMEGPGAIDVDIHDNKIRGVNHWSLKSAYPSPISVGVLVPVDVKDIGMTFRDIRVHDNEIQLQHGDNASPYSFGSGVERTP